MEVRSDEAAPAVVIGPTCPHTVRWASMVHRWDNLTFLHWPYDPDVVQRLLPAGLTVETFDGVAWVALVPFEMEVRLARGGALPWVSHFPETNVRTYAVAEDGTVGVWFLSLDAARFGAAFIGRTTYRLPYYWSKMSATRMGDFVTYRSRRRWPGPRGARSEVVVEVEPGGPHEPWSDRDHWMTARWRLFSAHARGIHAARAEHGPWELHRARVLHCDDELITAAGLPAPEGEPIVHHSPGIEVRIGFPHRVHPRA